MSHTELLSYLHSTFKILCACDPSVARSIGKSPIDLALLTARELFEDLDTDGSGFIDYNEFAAAYGAADGYTGDVSLDPAFVTSTLHLDQFSPAEVLEMFTEVGRSGAASQPSRPISLTASQFARACRTLTTLGSSGRGSEKPLPPSAAEEFAARLFELLDLDGNGVVTAAELLAGISVLMPGTPVEKVSACFAAFDADNDGT